MVKKNALSYVARMMIFAVVMNVIWGGIFGASATAASSVLTISVDKTTLSEGENAIVTLTLTPPISNELQAGLTLVPGANMLPADYTLLPAFVTIPANTASGTTILSAVQDYTTEADETIELKINSATLPQSVTAQVTPVTVTFRDQVVPILTSDLSSITAGQKVVFTVGFEGGIAATGDVVLTLDFSQSDAELGVDYIIIPPDASIPLNQSPMDLNFKAGDKQKTITVVATADQDLISPKKIVATLSKGGTVVNDVRVDMVDGGGQCIGDLMGKTSNLPSPEGDHGVTNFNSHEGAEPSSETVDLSILGFAPPDTPGYAPAQTQAACVTTEDADGNYPLKGYAWNTNIGFISLFCDGVSNFGVNCGDYEYGVKMGPIIQGTPDVRVVTGMAWNPTFGYISFSGNWNDGAGVSGSYGVEATRDPNSPDVWNFSNDSFAWTQAGVYLKLDGVSAKIPPGIDNGCTESSQDFPCCLNPLPEICECSEVQQNDNTNLTCYCPAHPTSPLCVPDNYCKEHPEDLAVCDFCTNNPTHADCLTPYCESNQQDVCCSGSPAQCSCKQNADANGGVVTDLSCCILDDYASTAACQGERPFCELYPENPVCFLVTPDPSLIDASSYQYLPVANCTDGYDMEFFLRNPSTRALEDYNGRDLIDLWFSWKDTVKQDQITSTNSIDAVGNGLIASPYSVVGGKGAVRYKPVEIHVTDLNSFNSNFDRVNGETGHYKLKRKIISCAPTTGGNVSVLETVAGMLFDNERFFYDESLEPLQKNDLILQNLVYQVTPVEVDPETGETVVGTSYSDVLRPNNAPAYFRFKPWLEIMKLATVDLKDAIGGFRDVPIVVNISAKSQPNPFPLEFLKTGDKVELVLTYKKALPDECKEFTGGSKYFNFLLEGTAVGSGMPPAQGTKQCDFSSGANCSFVLPSLKVPLNLSMTPALPLLTGKIVPQAICTKIPAPSLYSMVSYTLKSTVGGGTGKQIKYYSNKLPRLEKGILDNITAIIHGTIYSAMTFSADATQNISPSGNQISNVVRDTVHQQVAKYIKSSLPKNSEKPAIAGPAVKCVASGMDINTGIQTSGQDCVTHKLLEDVEVGEAEKADYFYGVNVVLGDDSGSNRNDFTNFGKRILVVEGGNLLINRDVYNSDETSGDQLVIAVFSVKDEGQDIGGNVYIADDVTTLSNVAIIADGSIHPFPARSSVALGSLDEKGVLSLSDLQNFFWGGHQESSQLFIKGAVSAKTSAGISSLVDVDKATSKGRHLNGAYEAVDTILKSMYYDWNMFRMYRGGVFETDGCPQGLVKDLSCGKCLTVGDQITISHGGEVCGEPLTQNEWSGGACVSKTALHQCNGIKVELRTFGGGGGDLLPSPEKESPLSRSNKPFYLYYSPINSALLNADGN